ncbi:DUF3331 domain-containing protein [Paraburkholderia caffeinilytica]|uniref:DUF3331 domain-containing protein n=1 Tax=Paraburkholderia caffeinilytica TaxID=1761016 RepID=UPI0038BB859E
MQPPHTAHTAHTRSAQTGSGSNLPRPGKSALSSPSRPRVRILQLERTSPTSLMVSWSDSTQCCYLDQAWVAVSARQSGYCALTGNAIRRGDAVFKPRCKGKRRPANYQEMILAREIVHDKLVF